MDRLLHVESLRQGSLFVKRCRELMSLLALALSPTLISLLAQTPNAPQLTDGTYRLLWDDELYGVFTGNKSCEIVVSVARGKISGSFKGLDDRQPALRGEMQREGQATLVTFRQIEDGYLCGYQMILQPQPTISNGLRESPPVYQGVWQDTKGRKGDFVLYRYQ